MRTNPERPHIGIGLTSACDTAVSAFLLSASGCNMRVEMALTGSAGKGFWQYGFAKDEYDAWVLQCEEADVLPFQAFAVDRPPQ